MISRRSLIARGSAFAGILKMSTLFDMRGTTSLDPFPVVAPLSPPFRLDESWYRRAVHRLQSKLAEKGLDGVVLSDPLNITYFSGLFHTSTERPYWLFVPLRGEPVFFFPGLDRDMLDTWWIKDKEWYFDFPHAGEFNRLVFKAGPKTDLLQWMLRGLAKRSFGAGKLGIEKEVGSSTMKKMLEALPEAKFTAIEEDLLKMRIVKTPEEVALTQKAIDLHDRMLSFARNYILKHGTSTTDFAVRHATEVFAAEELAKVLRPDGRPHQAVGVDLSFGCRTGVGTAYPHPNQFFYARIQRGDAIQIAARISIGGYGGEGYRALQAYPASDLHKKMWDVHTEMTLKQQELSKAGVRCNEVAEMILDIPLKAGLEKYVYHRPAHGEGMEGHQAPYLSPGDDTVLEEGMMFSNEPGLYNPKGGFGYNHSNCVLVTKERGVQMNKTPLIRDWCWIRI